MSDVDATGMSTSDGVVDVAGWSRGSFSRETSRRSKGLVPRPGKRISVAPLLCGEDPTAMPKSPELLYFPDLAVGGMAETGQPKGNLNWFLMSGTLPVTIS